MKELMSPFPHETEATEGGVFRTLPNIYDEAYLWKQTVKSFWSLVMTGALRMSNFNFYILYLE